MTRLDRCERRANRLEMQNNVSNILNRLGEEEQKRTNRISEDVIEKKDLITDSNAEDEYV